MKRRPRCPLPSSDSRESKQPAGVNEPPPTLNPEAARTEARRCLFLNPCDGCEACILMCPDQAIAKDPETQKAVIDLRYCKGCGLCAHVCPKGAITMVPEQD